LSVDIVEQIILIRDEIWDDINLKWEPKEKLHLTIKFIGDVSSQITDDISNELVFIENYASIKCAIKNFGFFYRDGRPNILWVGLETDVFLKRLITELNQRLNKFSIPIDNRKFNPHITLLRIKNDPANNFVNNFKNFTFKPILFRANSISLYKSILHPEGSIYSEIKNYKLKELEI
jgi:2'-5' RNA ligase